MWKKVLISAAAVALAGSSLVYAQQRFGGQDGPRMVQRWQPSAEDVAAFTDAGVAAMHAGLKLTPDQEKNWPAFETAARGIAKLRAERREARQNQQRPGNVAEFLQRRADAMTRGATALKQLSDATGPLYQSLDEGQKRRFGIIARMLRPHARMAGMERRGFGPRGGGPGDGMRPRGNFDPGFNRGFERRRFGDRDMRPLDGARPGDRGLADRDGEEPGAL